MYKIRGYGFGLPLLTHTHRIAKQCMLNLPPVSCVFLSGCSVTFGRLCGCVSSLEQLVSIKDGSYVDKELVMRLFSHFMRWRDTESDLFLFDW